MLDLGVICVSMFHCIGAPGCIRYSSRVGSWRIGQLSAGERCRVQLAKMLKSGANLLLLDEPADDLDTLSAGSAG